MHKVVFGNSGQEIQGTLIVPKQLKKKNPGVVIIHGFGSSEKNYLPLAERLAEYGIIALTVNLREHGVGAKENSTIKVKDGFLDGLSSYDFLVGKDFIDKDRIGMCGSSFGGGISAYVSGERKLKSLVLRAPAAYTGLHMNLSLKEILNAKEDGFNRMQKISDTPVIKNLEKFTGSMLVISSEHDVTIPSKMIKAFFDAPKHLRKKELIEIKGAHHALDKDSFREEFRSLALDWFQKTL